MCVHCVRVVSLGFTYSYSRWYHLVSFGLTYSHMASLGLTQHHLFSLDPHWTQGRRKWSPGQMGKGRRNTNLGNLRAPTSILPI